MATTFSANSTQYAGFIATPPSRAVGGQVVKYFPFDVTLTGSPTATWTVGLVVLPPYSVLLMLESAFWFAGATATETIDIGWDAYKATTGAVVADDDGLIDGVLMTTDATWKGGALITASAIAQSLPIVNTKAFLNVGDVVLYASLKVANPGAADTINGYFAVMVG